MTLLLKQLFAFLKVLNSDTGENQVAAGIACGLILGFAPARGFVSSSSGYVDAIVFPSASQILGSL